MWTSQARNPSKKIPLMREVRDGKKNTLLKIVSRSFFTSITSFLKNCFELIFFSEAFYKTLFTTRL